MNAPHPATQVESKNSLIGTYQYLQRLAERQKIGAGPKYRATQDRKIAEYQEKIESIKNTYEESLTYVDKPNPARMKSSIEMMKMMQRFYERRKEDASPQRILKIEEDIAEEQCKIDKMEAILSKELSLSLV